MIGFASALEGLARSEAQLNQAARTIARAPLSTEATDTVDLSAAAVALLTARNNFEDMYMASAEFAKYLMQLNTEMAAFLAYISAPAKP